MLPLRMGIDNYCMYPTGMDPLDILRRAKSHGAEGVAFSGLHQEALEALDDVSISAIRSFIAENNMYLEWGGGQHIPVDMTTWQRKDIAKNNLAAVRLAKRLGTTIIRSCFGGLMRWDPSSPPTEHFMHEMALFLVSQKQMLTDHGVVLAIETHLEFTTFELLKVFEMCGAYPREYLGICLDTMNLMTMLENPLYATERILPWVVSTHIKDGGILTSDSGLITFPAAIGTGIIDLEGIIRLLISTGQHIHLSIEDHGGWIDAEDWFRS